MSFNTAIARLPEADFNLMLKNGHRSSVLCGHDFESLIYCSYKFLKETLPDLIKKGNFEKLVLECFADRGIVLFDCDVNSIDNNDILYFIFWIKDELERIAKMEELYLSGETDFDLIAAGLQDLNQFGDLNLIDSLAVKYGKSHEEVKGWRYNFIFDLQYKQIIESRIQSKLIEIKQSKEKKKR